VQRALDHLNVRQRDWSDSSVLDDEAAAAADTPFASAAAPILFPRAKKADFQQ
jgi:hypothetical protein